MLFSFVITYRDRKAEAVKRNLRSLLAQKISDNFEICFVDYGSKEQNRRSIVDFCAEEPRIRYEFMDTEGWLWCRAQANNRGIALAKGEIVVMVDVDLMYPPFFLAKVKAHFDQNPKTLLMYHCYFAPKDFKDYEKIAWHTPPPSSWNVSSANYHSGLAIVEKEAFEKAGWFDEYFKIWGMEDTEMNLRIQNIGYPIAALPKEQAFTVHQWHPSNQRIANMPQNWYEVMKAHQQAQYQKIEDKRYMQAPSQKRVLLERKNAKKPDLKLHFEVPSKLAFNRFFKAFQQLKSGEIIAIEQTFDWIKPQEQSKLAKVVHTTNQLLGKAKVSYRMTEINTYLQGEILDFVSVRDFICFFILEFEAQIADYYYEAKYPESLVFWVMKK
ncbi:MAG: glycosyltransferase family 2 protein [Bernardetiaceae bacterium]|nr:glycosyltransferase family 2 protein [Bernardetiaceae bacterium]